MKIVHTSDIRLGAYFPGMKLAGDRLRVGLKAALSRIVDYAISEKVDLVLIAGNLFDSHGISQNLQDFAVAELRRLGSIPAVVVPGSRDHYGEASFWNSIGLDSRPANLFIAGGKKAQHMVFPELDCAVYCFPCHDNSGQCRVTEENLRPQPTKFHVGVAGGSLPGLFEADNPYQDLLGKLNYLALGGQPAFLDLSHRGIKAVYSGAPEKTDFTQADSGHLAKVTIDDSGHATVEKVAIGKFVWHSLILDAKEILSNGDVIDRIRPFAGPNSALRVTLSGLALFEAGLDVEQVLRLMESEFMYLDIVDELTVFPENVSAVKASEKTLLGQYFSLMADRLKEAPESVRPRIEKSIRIGYLLLAGRETF